MVDAKALALTLGVTWGVGIFLLGLMAAFLDWGTLLVKTMGSVYLGYEPTVVGSFVGLVWGFVDGTISGFVLTWVYNYFAG